MNAKFLRFWLQIPVMLPGKGCVRGSECTLEPVFRSLDEQRKSYAGLSGSHISLNQCIYRSSVSHGF